MGLPRSHVLAENLRTSRSCFRSEVKRGGGSTGQGNTEHTDPLGETQGTVTGVGDGAGRESARQAEPRRGREKVGREQPGRGAGGRWWKGMKPREGAYDALKATKSQAGRDVIQF